MKNGFNLMNPINRNESNKKGLIGSFGGILIAAAALFFAIVFIAGGIKFAKGTKAPAVNGFDFDKVDMYSNLEITISEFYKPIAEQNIKKSDGVYFLIAEQNNKYLLISFPAKEFKNLGYDKLIEGKGDYDKIILPNTIHLEGSQSEINSQLTKPLETVVGIYSGKDDAEYAKYCFCAYEQTNKSSAINNILTGVAIIAIVAICIVPRRGKE